MSSYNMRKKQNKLNNILCIIGANMVVFAFFLAAYDVQPALCVAMGVIGSALFVDSFKNIGS